MTSTESGHYLIEVQDWKREYDHEEIVENMVLLCDLDNMNNVEIDQENATKPWTSRPKYFQNYVEKFNFWGP